MRNFLMVEIISVRFVLLTLAITFPLLVLFFFPSPFFGVAYDSEADYFSNILSLYVNGHPVDYLHPGTPITYGAYFILNFFQFDNAESFILFVRGVLLYINIILIYVSSRIIKNVNSTHILLLILLLFIHPSTYYYIDFLSPNGILIGMSLIVASLGYRIYERGYKYSIWYGVSLATIVAIKLSALILVAPFFIATTIKVLNSDHRTESLRRATIVAMSFTIVFLLLIFPFIPIFPLYITQHLSPSLAIEYFSVNGVLIVTLVTLVVYRVHKAARSTRIYSTYSYVDIYKNISSFLVLMVVVDISYNLSSYFSYTELAISSRNSLPLLGFLILFINMKRNYSKGIELLFVFALVLVLSLKVRANYISYGKAEVFNSDFDLSMNLINKKEHDLVLYPTSWFTSKRYFFSWSNYRYGDRVKNFQNSRKVGELEWKDIDTSIKILNSRSFYLPADISSKLSYKYLEFFLAKDFISKLQKKVIENHLYLLHRRDMCTEPYDDYKKGSNFIVVIPKNIRFVRYGEYLRRTGKDISNNIMKKISDEWEEKCGFSVDIGTYKGAGVEYKVLTVNTERGVE